MGKLHKQSAFSVTSLLRYYQLIAYMNSRYLGHFPEEQLQQNNYRDSLLRGCHPELAEESPATNNTKPWQVAQ